MSIQGSTNSVISQVGAVGTMFKGLQKVNSDRSDLLERYRKEAEDSKKAADEANKKNVISAAYHKLELMALKDKAEEDRIQAMNEGAAMAFNEYKRIDPKAIQIQKTIQTLSRKASMGGGKK